MSFYAPYVMKAVRDRLLGDNTLKGYLTSPYVFLDEAAAGTAMPYVVLEWLAATPTEEGFDYRRHTVFFDLHVFVAANEGTDYTELQAQIQDRIVGNWDEDTTARVPTYGLDRYQLTLAAGAGAWVCTHVRHIDTRRVPQPDEGFVQWTLSFEVTAQKGLSAPS